MKKWSKVFQVLFVIIIIVLQVKLFGTAAFWGWIIGLLYIMYEHDNNERITFDNFINIIAAIFVILGFISVFDYLFQITG